MTEQFKPEEIGYWSEIKLDIVKEYAKAYSTILAKQPRLSHVYIDAFAGGGVHVSRRTGEFVPGSPLNALAVSPPFDDYYFIDLDGSKAAALRSATANNQNVKVYEGDCNEILLREILPQVRYEDYRRGLCLLDPYGLHLNWNVLEALGKSRAIDVFLNFPTMDMNRNVLWKNAASAPQSQVERMNRFWGSASWQTEVYVPQATLFGGVELEKEGPGAAARAFRERLKKVAGFAEVPEPVPMRNSRGFVLYYLFFASQKPVAAHIIRDIFNKYRNRGAPPLG